MSASGKGPKRSGQSARTATLLRAITDRLSRNDDARARKHGWQVTSRRGGLAKIYRDPRFELLRACPACFGTGTEQRGRACERCSGTGLVMLTAKPQTEAGRRR